MLYFDWDDANREHIARHGVSPEEADEVAQSRTLELDAYEVDGEQRVDEVGMTKAGKVLKIVTTVREGRARIVTADEPERALKLAFLTYQRDCYD